MFAAGLPGVAADGRDAPFQASVTAFHATDGTLRAIAGQLGDQGITIRQVLVP